MISEQHIFRAVAGAVKNASDGHPSWKFTRTMADSIAKRATGTLAASLREVLAAGPSGGRVGAPLTPLTGKHALTLYERSRAIGGGRGHARGALPANKRRSPLRFLHNAIGAMVGEARRAGRREREKALVEVLRLIAEQQQRVTKGGANGSADRNG